MSNEIRRPDEFRRVAVPGGEVMTYSYGQGSDTILFLQGGPGLNCDHLRRAHADTADKGYRAVFFDQLGTGESDKPDDASLWTIERYARETEAVRTALDLGPVHLYGHSWGAMLAIEYACTFPQGLRSLVIAHGIANCPLHQQEVNRLMAAFGPEFVRMRRRHELLGHFDHPEYQAAELLMLYRHAIRMNNWPSHIVEDLQSINVTIRKALIGEEYFFHGNLRHWNRVPDMHRITQPTLILTGEYDALTPNEAEEMHSVLPNSALHLFTGIAHLPFMECPDEYYPVVEAFWNAHRNP